MRTILFYISATTIVNTSSMNACYSFRKNYNLSRLSIYQGKPAPTKRNVPLATHPTAEELNKNITKCTCTILYLDKPVSSGVIIQKHFALTTCNSVYKKSSTPAIPEDLGVMWGIFEKRVEGMVTMMTSAKRLFISSECKRRTHSLDSKGDIAIIQTVKPMLNNEFLYYAILPRYTQFAWCAATINRYLFLSNFKQLDVANTLTDAVWMIKTPLIDSEFCSSLFNKSVFDPLRNLCTTYTHDDGSDCCETDIGSALTFQGKVCGLLSFKVSCGAARSVGSFVSISRHADWIRRTVDEASDGRELV